MSVVNPIVKTLHAEYCARSGFDLTLNYQREQAWNMWRFYRRENPFTVEDLKRVIAYLRKEISDEKRNAGALKFSNLIESPDRFEEDLNLAKSQPTSNHATTPRKPSKTAQELRKPIPEAERATPEDLQEFWRKK